MAIVIQQDKLEMAKRRTKKLLELSRKYKEQMNASTNEEGDTDSVDDELDGLLEVFDEDEEPSGA